MVQDLAQNIKYPGKQQLLIKTQPPAFPLYSLRMLVIIATCQDQHLYLALLPIPDADLRVPRCRRAGYGISQRNPLWAKSNADRSQWLSEGTFGLRDVTAVCRLVLSYSRCSDASLPAEMWNIDRLERRSSEGTTELCIVKLPVLSLL